MKFLILASVQLPLAFKKTDFFIFFWGGGMCRGELQRTAVFQCLSEYATSHALRAEKNDEFPDLSPGKIFGHCY